jgi:trehalose 6-phosphate phosphatase
VRGNLGGSPGGTNGAVPDADALLAPLTEAPRRSALLLDVDGTLAPIVARPELAAVPDATKAELRRLVGRYALVAAVSGRAGDDAARLVGVPGIEVVGNHGLELDPRAEELAGELARFRDSTGLPVEDKRLSLSYHYREAPDPDAARAALEDVARNAEEAGFVPRWGRMVLEIRPPVDTDKGVAVRTLLARSGATRALYAGDDTTDLDAFAGLRDAGLEHAVCVAVASEEGPTELRDAADLVVEGPEAMAGLLARL